VNTPRDDRREQLEALLREPAPTLAPRDGMWEAISRRARRRRIAKAALSVAAGVIVVAGAVPAVIAVRHSADSDARLTFGGGRHDPTRPPTAATSSIPTPLPTAGTLNGFYPESVSFVSQQQGFLYGSIGSSSDAVIAETVDGGLHWIRRPAPPVEDAFVGSNGRGIGQIRFSTDGTGFLFGSSYWISRDHGSTWTKQPFHGYIDALETRDHEVWALARPGLNSTKVSLYTATTSDPTLRRVRGVPTMTALPGIPSEAGEASLAVSGEPNGVARVVVIVGERDFWISPNGTKWVRGHNPCPVTGLRSTLVAISGERDVIAACGYTARQSGQSKRIFTSVNSGHKWKATKADPARAGFLETLTAGTATSAMLGTSRGGAQLTADGGKSWSTVTNADGFKLSFVGYIDTAHIVAAANRDSSKGAAFATSTDGGDTWTVTRFPAE